MSLSEVSPLEIWCRSSSKRPAGSVLIVTTSRSSRLRRSVSMFLRSMQTVQNAARGRWTLEAAADFNGIGNGVRQMLLYPVISFLAIRPNRVITFHDRR